MPKLSAETDEGVALEVHIPAIVSWVLSLAGVATIAAVGLLINLNLRVSVIESNRFTANDGRALVEDMVPRSEYEARHRLVDGRLERMEEKLDAILLRLGGG